MSLIAHAHVSDYGRAVRINVGYHKIWGNQQTFQPLIFDNGETRIGDEETVSEHAVPENNGGLTVSLEAAQAMYEALDRVFGKQDETPGIVKEVLKREQARVDKLLDHLTS